MIRFSRVILLTAFLALYIPLPAQERQPDASSISLPTSKILTTPTPGRLGSTNSFPGHHRDQPGWPLRRAAEQRLWHSGDAGDAVDRDSGLEDESTLRFSR